jgi:hypothetical protein
LVHFVSFLKIKNKPSNLKCKGVKAKMVLEDVGVGKNDVKT